MAEILLIYGNKPKFTEHTCQYTNGEPIATICSIYYSIYIPLLFQIFYLN